MEEKKTKLPSEAAELSDESMDEVSGGAYRHSAENDGYMKCKDCSAVFPKKLFMAHNWRCPNCGADNRPAPAPEKKDILTIL